ncbi:MAG: hypothetical protein HOP28_05700 [Gemmatimonadales bacterium]|nr:hypothetical protein [Gemmatimonadales bacterium]
MVAGRDFWIVIWFGILLLGLLGLGASIYWGRETHWRNLDELLRAVGTITVSTGMLLLLRGVATGLGQGLLVAALLSFILAFIFGRKLSARPVKENAPTPDPPEPPQAVA